jgi:hypothetical protein
MKTIVGFLAARANVAKLFGQVNLIFSHILNILTIKNVLAYSTIK